jgi:putative transposase
VVSMCRVLRAHRSGYYAWLKEPMSNREKEDQRLVGLIREFHEASDRSYGSPRITRDLREMGEHCGKHRVARLMKQEGLRAKVGGISPLVIFHPLSPHNVIVGEEGKYML